MHFCIPHVSTIGMFFMGLNMHTMNATQGYIASLAVFIGSAYMLKFPLHHFLHQFERLCSIFRLQ